MSSSKHKTVAVLAIVLLATVGAGGVYKMQTGDAVADQCRVTEARDVPGSDRGTTKLATANLAYVDGFEALRLEYPGQPPLVLWHSRKAHVGMDATYVLSDNCAGFGQPKVRVLRGTALEATSSALIGARIERPTQLITSNVAG